MTNQEIQETLQKQNELIHLLYYGILKAHPPVSDKEKDTKDNVEKAIAALDERYAKASRSLMLKGVHHEENTNQDHSS